MTPENFGNYLEAARQRRLDEQKALKQQLAARHEARRTDFEGRSEPLNVYLAHILEDARSGLTGAGAKLEYKLHRYNAAKQLENPRVEFQISSLASPSCASSVYVIEIATNGDVVVRTKQAFGDPDSTLAVRQFPPRTIGSLKDIGLTDVIKAAIDEYVIQGG